jgi:hypothetical protein
MSVNDSKGSRNPNSDSQQSPEQIASELQRLSQQLQTFIPEAASRGDSFDKVERKTWKAVREIGFQAMELLLSLQGQGDLGDNATTDEGKTLVRSDHPGNTSVRSIFGTHQFSQFTYSAGKNKTIQLRPISTRLQLSEQRWSFLLQEFSQLFCVESAFNQSADNMQTVFDAKFSIDTLERNNQQMGIDAGRFLSDLPKPKRKEEGEIFVATADCKGVPLVKKDAARVAAFETAKKRPGNRRMATVTSAYSVEAFIRSPQSIIESLFRDERDESAQSESEIRPKPKTKNTTAHFPTIVTDDDKEIRISGIHEGMAWLAEQVATRRRKNQKLVVLMDGQESLWDTAALHWDDDDVVEVLDFLHVAVYVWEAAGLFSLERDEREKFTRLRLEKLLGGEVQSVIRGLRRMGALRELEGEKKTDLARICGYLKKHQSRMSYDVYLREGYPIASGVIEGACRHLVKDRMERSGMRWTLEGARSMLNVRAAFQSDYWKLFHTTRIAEQSARIHRNRAALENYNAFTLSC